jgi:hypothetical protein
MWNKICGGAVLMVIHFCGGLWTAMRWFAHHLKPTGKPAGMPWKLHALPHLKKFKPQIYVG